MNLELFASSTTSSCRSKPRCIAFRASTLAVVASPRVLHVVRESRVVGAYRSARSDIVHIEFATSNSETDILLAVLADGRLIRVQLALKRARESDDFSNSLDDFPVAFEAKVEISSVQRVCESVWLLQVSDAGASRLVRALSDDFSRFEWLIRDNIDWSRPITLLRFIGSGENDFAFVHSLEPARLFIGGSTSIDMRGETIVHVDTVVVRGRQCLCVVGAFGTVAFVAGAAGGDRVWRLSVSLSRCVLPCAIANDGELLLVNNGERLVVVSLRDWLPDDVFFADAAVVERSMICNAPHVSLRRSVPVALELRRTVSSTDVFVAAALLSSGSVLTLGREILHPETFPVVALPHDESLQDVLAELEAAANSERELAARNTELTASLKDLVAAVSIAPSIVDRSALHCRLQASMGQFSVFDQRALIGIHVTYTGGVPLSNRWSLAVRTRRTEPLHASRGVASTHHVVPLTQLPPSATSNATWTMVVGVPFDVMTSISVSVDLVFVPLSDRGWLVPLVDEQLFDALDFCKLSLPSPTLEALLTHSGAIALHSDWHALLGNAAAEERAAQLLTLLVPACAKRAVALLLLASGDLVRLRMSQTADFRLEVQCECANARQLTMIRTCLRRRIASIRRDKAHAAVAAQLSHYALSGGGGANHGGGAVYSASEALLGVARAVKQCSDTANSIRDDVDVLIARQRAFAADDASVPTTIHLRQSVSEMRRARERIEQVVASLRQTIGQNSMGL
jgi:hypothetical protein